MKGIRVASALLVLSSSFAAAQVQPVVRVAVSPESVAVGDFATVEVTVLVPTWFVRPPVYPNLELANAITRLPPDSSYPTSERIGRDTWSGIVRKYQVFPLLGATYRLGGQDIRIAYANPGGEPTIIDAAMPDIVVRGAVPDGAGELDPYLSGSRLTVSMDIEGDTSALEPGDAIVLRYRAELDGLPAIFIPPLAPALEFEGVSVYADAPRVEDGAPAMRSETLTLVFESGGEFMLPGLSFEYWNTVDQQIAESTADGVSIVVHGPPAAGLPAGAERVRDHRWLWLPGGLVFLALLAFGLRRRRRLRKVSAAERARRLEKRAFGKFSAALRARDPVTSYRSMLAWIRHLDPETDARRFVQHYGSEGLPAAVDMLSRCNFSSFDGRPDYSSLRTGFVQARKRYFRQGPARELRQLAALNP